MVARVACVKCSRGFGSGVFAEEFGGNPFSRRGFWGWGVVRMARYGRATKGGRCWLGRGLGGNCGLLSATLAEGRSLAGWGMVALTPGTVSQNA